MIDVYRWDMRLNPRSETGFRVGHVSIMVSGVYMSWFPTKHGAYSSKARPGQTLDDDIKLEKSQPLPPLRVGTAQKSLDETAMKVWWQGFTSNPPVWALGSTNCAQIVVDALRAGGADKYIKAQNNPLIAYYYMKSVVWRPWLLPEYIDQINAGLAAS